jgi:hypothetical protein
MVGGMFVLDYAVWKHMWESRRKRVKDGVQLAMSHEGRRWNECTRPSPIYHSATPQPALALAARHHSRGGGSLVSFAPWPPAGNVRARVLVAEDDIRMHCA